MREEQITLPESQSELQFECLRLRESLIEARAAKEHCEEENASEIEVLKTELSQSRMMVQHERRSPDNDELRQTINDLEKRLGESQITCTSLSRSLDEYRNKCSQLQIELDNSETVQKDFVKLSQQLQVQLEKIRQGEQELRWQFPEDTNRCNKCEGALKKDQAKSNCMHCGKIFCTSCITNMAAGSSNRQTKVCSVCHTLLNR
jgi:Rab GTPase-binding effector protein 1